MWAAARWRPLLESVDSKSIRLARSKVVDFLEPVSAWRRRPGKRFFNLPAQPVQCVQPDGSKPSNTRLTCGLWRLTLVVYQSKLQVYFDEWQDQATWTELNANAGLCDSSLVFYESRERVI